MSQNTPMDQLMKDPKTAGLLKDKAAMERLLTSPEVKKLMELLSSSPSAGLEQAAQAAMRGDAGGLKDLVGRVMGDPEGAKAVENLNKTIR